MKYFLLLFAALALGIFPLACGDNGSNPYSPTQPTATPTITSTPCGFPGNTCTFTPTVTPTNTPIVDITFSVYSPSLYVYKYSTSGTGGPAVSAPITITAGHAAVWDSSNSGSHSLYLDNGSTCLVTAQTTGFPMTMALPSGTYHIHCGYHGSCSSGDTVCPNTTCTGMAATIVAQ